MQDVGMYAKSGARQSREGVQWGEEFAGVAQ